MSAMPPRPQTGAVPDLQVPPDLEVEYVNLVRIAHSPAELVFDFARVLPGEMPAKIRSRIVMSPLGAKLLFRALADNLAKYESAFGEIKVPGDNSLADYLFHSPQPPEKPSK